MVESSFFWVCLCNKEVSQFQKWCLTSFFQPKKLRSLQGLSTSAVVFYTKMDSDSPKHRWVKILWTHTPTGFVKLIIILVVFVALGSNSGKQPYPVCSCLKTSWSATWRTDFGPFWLWQGVPSCVESYLVSSAAPAITPLSAQFSFTCHARHLRWSGQRPHSLEDTPQQQNHRQQWKISTKPFLQDAMAVQAKMQKDCFGINLWNQLHYLERM